MVKEFEIKDLQEEGQVFVKQSLTRYFGAHGSAEILDYVRLINLPKGQTLVEQNEIGSTMYILSSGSLEAFISMGGKQIKVGSVKRGECVGEMALLGNNKRSATVIARRNSLLISVSLEGFKFASKKDPSIVQSLSEVIIERLKKANENTSARNERSKFIGLVNVGGKQDDITSLASNIQEYWAGVEQIKVLQKQDVESLDDIQFSLFINSLETYDYVVLLSTGDGAWHQRVWQNSDKIVYHTQENQISQFKALEVGLHDELILAYEQVFPDKVSAFFSYFTPQKVYKYKKGSKTHQDRISRIVCEQQICLVLGGGGAHGLAVVGVLERFIERGIPIDVVGGTSIGSIISGAIAQDWEFKYIEKNIRKDISEHNPLNDYTVPFVALIKGRKMRKVLKKHFDIPLENAWKNMFCIASNLSTAKTELILEGPMDKAIAASISIPGILPPSLHRKSLLIDGGVLNNLPADIMAKTYNGYVISVDVVSMIPRTIDHEYQVGNWQWIKNTLTGRRKNYVPNTMNTIMKAITLASTERSHEKEAISDIYFTPRIKKGFLDWKAMDAFVDAGKMEVDEKLHNLDYKKILNLP